VGNRQFNPVHTVEPGDTLWGIAARALVTKDAARIAGYWPAIHHHNRALIGSDPDLLIPGQILQLPREHRP
jgi:nucleoid-associated protein YgaU